MIRIHNLNKTFSGTHALKDLTLNIEKGEMVALIGASGSGKSTLIRHMSGLVQADPNSGSIHMGGRLIQSGGLISKKIREIRSSVGVIFQGFNLVGRLNVETNVMLGALGRAPLWRALISRFGKEEKRLALEAMDKVGILKTAGRRACTLSGGQRQRAAIARALVQKAGIILADEPIASLDPESAKRVMEILNKLNKEDGLTVVVSLHQVEYAKKYCHRAIALNSGRICYDGPSDRLSEELLRDIYGGSFEELCLGEATHKETEFEPIPELPAFPEEAAAGALS
jgi:phosphonate transport system ATP-binding protein